LIDKSKIASDGEAFFKWLVESCEQEDNEISQKEIWNVKEIGSLFNEKLGSGTRDFSDLSLDGFLCIQSYFLLENENEKKLIKYNYKPVSSNKFTSYSNTGGSIFSNFNFNSKPKNQEKSITKYKVYFEPKELAGIENIWRIVIESNNKEVNQKAVELLTNLYKSLSGEVAEK